ncbi:Inhibitor of apoptosis-promoting Bax1 [Trypanosoma brucei equiperdum]|uniref:Inhibitor of apoptosis-promoting Bax1 n=1 Tax=Trypanosoma brucei equiperdum TaxID=630700 RepID=A0A3L6KT16_9TRYP|nr:Inhibitor of apoptosis-promoting Bax1 [Trypanosoma brucei equiperdum]
MRSGRIWFGPYVRHTALQDGALLASHGCWFCAFAVAQLCTTTKSQFENGPFLRLYSTRGKALAPLIASSMAKGVLGTAIVLTGAVFCGFSAGAYLAPRASLLALQGPLFGMLLGMVAISVLNLFYPTAFVHSIILYGGLALFSVMVSVDTQAMIERARCGAGDVVQDALQMFMNVVNIFVRIAQILGSGDR